APPGRRRVRVRRSRTFAFVLLCLLLRLISGWQRRFTRPPWPRCGRAETKETTRPECPGTTTPTPAPGGRRRLAMTMGATTGRPDARPAVREAHAAPTAARTSPPSSTASTHG